MTLDDALGWRDKLTGWLLLLVVERGQRTEKGRTGGLTDKCDGKGAAGSSADIQASKFR